MYGSFSFCACAVLIMACSGKRKATGDSLKRNTSLLEFGFAKCLLFTDQLQEEGSEAEPYVSDIGTVVSSLVLVGTVQLCFFENYK